MTASFPLDLRDCNLWMYCASGSLQEQHTEEDPWSIMSHIDSTVIRRSLHCTQNNIKLDPRIQFYTVWVCIVCKCTVKLKKRYWWSLTWCEQILSHVMLNAFSECFDDVMRMFWECQLTLQNTYVLVSVTGGLCSDLSNSISILPSFSQSIPSCLHKPNFSTAFRHFKIFT